MGMFSNLMSKVFGHAAATPTAAAPAAAPTSTPAPAPAAPEPAAPAVSAPAISNISTATTPLAGVAVETVKAAAAPVVAKAVEAVDVTAILDGMAAKSEEKGLDWKHSIVDLLKLVGMDSSLAARKELAHDLGYTGDTSDTATMNVWLIKEVLTKFAANGGKIPAGLGH